MQNSIAKYAFEIFLYQSGLLLFKFLAPYLKLICILAFVFGSVVEFAPHSTFQTFNLAAVKGVIVHVFRKIHLQIITTIATRPFLKSIVGEPPFGKAPGEFETIRTIYKPAEGEIRIVSLIRAYFVTPIFEYALDLCKQIIANYLAIACAVPFSKFFYPPRVNAIAHHLVKIGLAWCFSYFGAQALLNHYLPHLVYGMQAGCCQSKCPLDHWRHLVRHNVRFSSHLAVF